jgi:hypothetical protein
MDVVALWGPWYPWTLERLGLKYQYQRFGMRNSVERFFGYLSREQEGSTTK